MMKVFFLYFLSLITALGIFAFVLPAEFTAPSEKKYFKTIEIKKGSSLKQIFALLKKEKLIQKHFPYFLFLRGLNLKAGEYALERGGIPYQILRKIQKGQVILYDVVFPEGWNMYEMADLLEKKGLAVKKDFLKISQDSNFIKAVLGDPLESLEGYLYPDTYKLSKNMKPEDIALIMVKKFLQVYALIEKEQPLSRHFAVILASLVEKETSQPFERAEIAGVFHNRLKAGMRLESDPTILYGILRETGKMPFNIRRKDILRKTAYNTYKIKALPKGPIANPGREALLSVFNPKKTDKYFFVSRNDGTHVFSKTFKEHEKMVDRYQRKRTVKKTK